MRHFSLLIVSSALIWQVAMVSSSQVPSCEISCPMYFLAPLPVCDDGKEYKDDCIAKCAGATNITPGPCPTLNPACICLAIYKPVCGDGIYYSNECQADCAGAKHIVEGPCLIKQIPCVCIKYYAPVCGDGKTYSNECEARCFGAKNIVEGPCPIKPRRCPCTREYRPVCGDGKTYPNKCVARCAGAKSIVNGRCPCICPRHQVPVCGSNGVTYASYCESRCAGVRRITRGPCCPPCAVRCADIYEPVCADGVTYKNACLTYCLCPRPKNVVPGECPRKGRYVTDY